ncbi:MAG TPA: MFS transporter [Solirubrobacteraceae bacterium]|nr:MFS transporter [Solirubrobacteraceae bacterium]
MRLPRLRPDLSPFRDSRDLRLVVGGSFVSNLGAQATLVALPFQLYLLTRSVLVVGLLGAVEIVPLVSMALLGGAIADRMDRRRLLLLTQIGLVATSGALALLPALGRPPVAALYVLGGLLAGCNALQNVAMSALVPNLIDRPRLPRVLAVSYGLSALSMVMGPGLGGLLIAAVGVQAAYTLDAVSCVAVVVTVLFIAAQPPIVIGEHPKVMASITEGLRYVRGNRALVGSFAIDLVAMTFGMPRALFAALAVSVFHAGAAGAGALYAAVPAGATVAALLTGWINHARRLGLVVIWSVAAWGAAVSLAGLMRSLWPAVALLAVAGAADSISAVCRSTINQTVTPDHMRGRMSAAFSLVVTGGPRLGDIESGSVAGAAGVRFSVASGGLACLLGVVVIALAFPALRHYDTEDWTSAPTTGTGDRIGEALEAVELT